MTILIALFVMALITAIGSVSFYREERIQREVEYAPKRKPNHRF